MAKKYNNKVPRKKKKELKKKAGLEGKKVSQAQVIELANKERDRQRRANNEARRYNENRALLQSVGLSTDIITKRTSQKETRRLVDEEIKRQKAAANKAQKQSLYDSKIERLKDAGFTETEATKIVGTVWQQISHNKIDAIIAEKKKKDKPPINDRIIMTSDEWLYVGYAETNDDMDFRSFKHYTSDELLDKIRMRYSEALFNPSGSDSMVGVFIVESGSKETCESFANDYYERGYNFKMAKGRVKLDSNRYFKLTCHNSYSMHNFLQLVLQVIANAKNEMVDHYMQQFKIFCNEAGFPFLDDL